MAWLLPRVYGYIWNPFVGLYAEAHSDIVLAVVVPVVGAMLAVVVYVQQRWNYKILSWATRKPRKKLQQLDY